MILPFTILRRLDCILEPTKDEVLAEYKKIASTQVDPGVMLEAKFKRPSTTPPGGPSPPWRVTGASARREGPMPGVVLLGFEATVRGRCTRRSTGRPAAIRGRTRQCYILGTNNSGGNPPRGSSRDRGGISSVWNCWISPFPDTVR